MYIDIHAHLTDRRYGGKTNEIVERCTAEDVKIIVDAGYDVKSSKNAFLNSQRFDGVFCTLGVHPEKPQDYTIDFEKFLLDNCSHEKVVAVGEIGLDYHYDGYDKKKQQEVFEKQIILADKLSLPIVVHSRDASNDVCQILTANKKHINRGFLMHCYSESIEQAKRYLDLGAYFSFGGVLTFKNSKRDEVVKSIPIDRVLAETDCPYLTPEPYRGKINYPYYVKYVYEKLCQIYDADMQSLQHAFYKNSVKLFSKISK